MKEWKNNPTDYKKGEVVILNSDRTDFRGNTTIKDKEEHFIIMNQFFEKLYKSQGLCT